MANYKLSPCGVIDTINNRFIPADPLNKDWVLFKQWEDDGNIPDPMDPISTDPGRTATVEASIHSDVAYGSLVKALASHFGLSLEQITTIISSQE